MQDSIGNTHIYIRHNLPSSYRTLTAELTQDRIYHLVAAQKLPILKQNISYNLEKGSTQDVNLSN